MAEVQTPVVTDESEPLPSFDATKVRELIHTYLGTVDMMAVTAKGVMKHLKEEHSQDFDKAFVKEVLGEFVAQGTAAAITAAEEEEEDEEEEEEESESDEEEEEPSVQFPADWEARFDEIVWVQTSKGWPWWPCIIINPLRVDMKIQSTALGHAGKRQTVMYYESLQIAFVTPSQMKPYLETKDEALASLRSEKKFAKHVTAVEAAVVDADADLAKDKSERLTAIFPIRMVRKRKAKKSSGAAKKKIKTAVAVSAKKPTQAKKPTKAVASSDMSGFNIPKPATAPSPGVAVAVPAPVAKAPKKAPKKKVAVAKAASPKKPKAARPAPAEEKSDSDGEAELDFDKADDDDDYEEEKPKKKKEKKDSSSSDADKKRKRDEHKSSDEKQSKKAKPSGSSASSSSKGKTESGPKDKKAKGSSTPTAKSAAKPAQAANSTPASASKLPADETNEMRARRLLGLLSKCGNEEKQSGPSASLKEKTLKYLDKLQQMRLTMDELKSTAAADVISQWRKHGDVDIATKAKTVRQTWKDFFQKAAEAAAAAGLSVTPGTVAVAAPSPAVATPVVETPVEEAPAAAAPPLPPAEKDVLAAVSVDGVASSEATGNGDTNGAAPASTEEIIS
jgi:hypothetical protein